MLYLFNLLSLYFYVLYFSNGKVKHAAIFVICSFVSITTHPFSLLITLALNAHFLIFRGKAGGPDMVRRWLYAQAAVGLSSLPFIIIHLKRASEGFGSWVYSSELATANFDTLVEMFFNFNYSYNLQFIHSMNIRLFEAVLYYLQYLFPAGILLGIASIKNNKNSHYLYLLVFISIFPVAALYIVSYYYKPMFAFRYLYLFHIGLIALFTAGLTSIKANTARRALIALVIIYLSVVNAMAWHRDSPHKWREAMKIVADNYAKGDVILIFHDGSHDPVNFYLPGGGQQGWDIKMIPFAPRYVFKTGQSPEEKEKQAYDAIAPLIKDYRRAWLVLNGSSDPENVVINMFKKFCPNTISFGYNAPILNLFVLSQ
jgi:hypothetical protein